MSKEKARRYNKGKERYVLFPQFAKKEIADVYRRGAHKYSMYRDKDGNVIQGVNIPIEEVGKYELVEDAKDNWRKGLSWTETVESAMRHMEAFLSGEDRDKELTTLHLANAAWNLVTVLELYKIYPEGDDRYHPYLNKKKIGLDIDEVLADCVGSLMEKFPEFKDRSVYWKDPIFSNTFEKVMHDPEFYLGMKPRIDPSSLPFEPHCYITSRACPTEVTVKWLDMHRFPKVPVYTVGLGNSKVEVAKKAGIDIFVDDSYANFVELNKAGVCTFLMTAPHNERYDVGYKRIKDLKEII